MRTKLVLISFTLLILFFNSCKHNPVDPGTTEPGRRDYTWTRDTLRADEFGFEFLTGIWGASPSDIWVIGDAATYVNKVWHYDGSKWHNYLLDKFATPSQICGISSSEIWMVTTISDIWKYDGAKWFKDTTIVPEGYQRILFEDVFGYTNDIYAVGIAEKSDGDYTGIIVHYDGKKWSILNTPKIKEYFIRTMFIQDGDILINGQDYFQPNEPSRLYKLKDTTLTLIQKSTADFYLGIIDNTMYVGNNKIIYSYDNGSLDQIIDLTNTDYLGSIYGRSTKDFFSANAGWNLGHYNGSDEINVYSAEGNVIEGQIFTKEVFFICYTLDNVNYILHGKLK